MTKRILTDAFVRNLQPVHGKRHYGVSDTLVPGLRVHITNKGHKSFVLWRRINKSASSASALVLGTVGVMTLSEARTKARAWLIEIEQGRDPRGAERAQRASTFGAVL